MIGNNEHFGDWKPFPHKRSVENLIFCGGKNVKLVCKGETLGVLKIADENQKPEDFANVVKTLDQLDHPNIVNILDYNLEAKRPYMVTQLCKGGTLKSVDLSQWTYEEKRNCFIRICNGIAYLWEHGLTKSDHNLQNIFLKEDNTPVIGDFETVEVVENNAEGIKKMLANTGYTFWEIIEGKRFDNLWIQEKRLNKKIESLTSNWKSHSSRKPGCLAVSHCGPCPSGQGLFNSMVCLPYF